MTTDPAAGAMPGRSDVTTIAEATDAVTALVLSIEAAGDPADAQYDSRIIRGLRSFGYTIARSEALSFDTLWREWERFNDKATDQGSGFTRDQMIGASAMLNWLLARLAAPAVQEEATDG